MHEEEPKTMEEICAALEAKGLIEPARNADGSIQQRPDRFGRLQTVWVSSDWGREVDALRGAALDPRERELDTQVGNAIRQKITAHQEEQLW